MMEMKEKNPYSLGFGKAPKQYISRNADMNDIIEVFNDEEPSQQLYIITGVRGSRKTVFMTEISRRIKELDPYRKRLIKRGIVNGDEWGRVSFTLPLFDEFVLTNYE